MSSSLERGPPPIRAAKTTTTTIVHPHLLALVHQDLDCPMESVLDPFLMSVAHASHPYALESDSDMETPQLSEALTETENDTPPETPLRPTMLLGGADHFHRYGMKEGLVTEIPGNLDTTCTQLTRSPMVPPPARLAQPLTMATPHPIRPALLSFRSLGVASRAGSFDEDGGYDSENEGQGNRPGLPRTRSYRLTPDQGRRVSSTRPGLPHRASSFLAKRPQEHVPSPLSTPTLGSGSVDDPTPPIARRPRHPLLPPMDFTSLALLDPRTAVDHGLDDGASVVEGLDQITNVEDLLNYTLTPEEEAQFMADLMINSEAVGFSPAPKDRSNEATGLGIGLPAPLDSDGWRVPTVAPTQVDSHPISSTALPQWLQTPSLLPVQEDDSSMSPLELTMPIVSPELPIELSDLPSLEGFDTTDDSLWQALEMGIWNGGSVDLARLSMGLDASEYVNSGMILDC